MNGISHQFLPFTYYGTLIVNLELFGDNFGLDVWDQNCTET